MKKDITVYSCVTHNGDRVRMSLHPEIDSEDFVQEAKPRFKHRAVFVGIPGAGGMWPSCLTKRTYPQTAFKFSHWEDPIQWLLEGER
jgi:hypothetical protein